jgi:hypothetical protein
MESNVPVVTFSADPKQGETKQRSLSQIECTGHIRAHPGRGGCAGIGIRTKVKERQDPILVIPKILPGSFVGLEYAEMQRIRFSHHSSQSLFKNIFVNRAANFNVFSDIERSITRIKHLSEPNADLALAQKPKLGIVMQDRVPARSVVISSC